MTPCEKCNRWDMDIEDIADMIQEDTQFLVRDAKLYAVCKHGNLADAERFTVRWIDSRRWRDRWSISSEIGTPTLARLVLVEIRRRLEVGRQDAA